VTDLELLKVTINDYFKDIKDRKQRGETVSFRFVNLYIKIEPLLQNDPDLSKVYSSIETKFTKKIAIKVFTQVFRFCFLSQVVWTKGGAANYTAHWFNPPFIDTDPRNASCEECFYMLKEVFASFEEELQNEDSCNNFKNIIKNQFFIDYKFRILEGNLHHRENIYCRWDDFPSRVTQLRDFLKNKTKNPKSSNFFRNAYSKIGTKAYLTDRGQTGEYQTNREKRWEAHPKSVHFALYKDCLEIEYTLITKILEFYDFPSEIIEKLEEDKIILKGEVTPNSCRCPITMDKLYFNEFEKELINQVHGVAKFQVGHIHPLKANTLNTSVGHTAQNVCWITAEGNEIQKNRSMEETQALMRRIFTNYQEAGFINCSVENEINDENN
jgi:hypothetical protein